MVTRHVHYEGRVQGVGFRYTARRIATGYDVAGWIRNLPDGRVEMKVTGEDEEVDEYLRAIRESELGGHIANAATDDLADVEEFKDFEIRS